MLETDLVEMVRMVQKQQAESQTIEVKKAADGCPKRLYDTLSSFSNQDKGGVILFGLDEKADFAVSGIYDLQDLQQKVTEQCKGMEPPVRAVFTAVEMDGKLVCSAEIPAVDISERPCYYGGAGRTNGAYIRVGDADLHMTDYEIYSFEAFRKHLHDDERPIERASFEDLDVESVRRFVEEKRDQRPGFMAMGEEKTLEMLNIMRNGHPTLAALLNFGIYPQGYLPQMGVLAVVFPGVEIGETDDDGGRFVDNKRIEGTIAAMVDETVRFCVRNMKVRTVIDPNTGQRQDETEYPVVALREAILNALIHRDYSLYSEGTAVQLHLFRDRVELHSPGNLYGRMTVEQLGETKPDLRNPVLALIAESQTQAENRYSGIPTMRRAMAAQGLPEPVFENRRNEFVVTFFNGSKATVVQTEPVKQALSGEDAALLEFCSTPRSREELLAYFDVKTWYYVNDHYIRPLLESGVLQMTLPDKPRSRKQRFYAVTQK